MSNTKMIYKDDNSIGIDEKSLEQLMKEMQRQLIPKSLNTQSIAKN